MTTFWGIFSLVLFYIAVAGFLGWCYDDTSGITKEQAIKKGFVHATILAIGFMFISGMWVTGCICIGILFFFTLLYYAGKRAQDRERSEFQQNFTNKSSGHQAGDKKKKESYTINVTIEKNED